MEEIIDNSGLYKKLENGDWLYARYEVISEEYTISRKEYEELGETSLKDGWMWFDKEPLEYTNWKEKIEANNIFNNLK